MHDNAGDLVMKSPACFKLGNNNITKSITTV